MAAIQITALNDPVAIVHIPLELAPAYATKLYWTIDSASLDSAEFFNVTSNRLESRTDHRNFSSVELVSAEWATVGDSQIRISASWKVFEISSGDEGDEGNYDSPHLRHVCVPLARAGISILYQSSYFTDFLLVKASDFDKASLIFAEQGWHVDPTSTQHTRRRSQLFSPLTPCPSPSPSPDPQSGSGSPPPPIPELTVLSGPLACVGLPHSGETRSGEAIRKFIVWPERCQHVWAQRRATMSESDDGSGVDDTQLDDIQQGDTDASRSGPPIRPFLSYTRTEDGSSLLTEITALRSMFEGDEGEVQSGGELSWSIFAGSEGFPDTDSDSHSDSDTQSEFEFDHRSELELDRDELHPLTPFSVRGSNEDPAVSLRDSITESRTPPALETVLPHPNRHSPTRHKKSLSLPSTPGLGNLTNGEMEEVPIFWRGRGGGGRGKGKGKCKGKGKVRGKSCMQLDLRGVGDGEDGDGQGAYHLERPRHALLDAPRVGQHPDALLIDLSHGQHTR
ncbi:hypothetical protein EHS25_010042 [Saitozyma podzolica]|uniref:CASTOR ACT domain-containing protein n=1 Tax=Saitozyma podzolica TaxID=1890683 RepID=A0A427YIE2_9TREE|nr:hypothetical protein EHS25_010042 [Saitozyma podzolica]